MQRVVSSHVIGALFASAVWGATLAVVLTIPSAPPSVASLLSASVRVENDNLRGSGTFVKIDGRQYILTVRHVVAPEDGPVVVPEDGPVVVNKRLPAVVVFEDKEKDLALLRLLDDRPHFCLTLGTTSPQPGDEIWTVGRGYVEKTMLSKFDEEHALFSSFGWYGHSGGGVFVQERGEWKLVGVVQMLESGTNPKSPVCACKWETLNSFVEDYRRR